MDRLDRLEQVVKSQNEAIKELQAEVKALKGEPSDPLSTTRMYAEDMEWKEGEEEEFLYLLDEHNNTKGNG